MELKNVRAERAMDVIYLVQQLYLSMKKLRPTERKGLTQGFTMSV